MIMQINNHDGANTSVNNVRNVNNHIEIMEVNKDQGALDISLAVIAVLAVEGTTVEVNIEGARSTTCSINEKGRGKTEVINKDSHTSITVEETVKQVNKGATANSNIHHAGPVSEQCIFKVHNLLRNVNSKDYEPEIISIGPYHHRKPNLQLMEAHKLRFQKLMLRRRKQDLLTYLEAIKPHEERARKSYAESTAHIPSEEFVKMLVLDGIFIIELLWKYDKGVPDGRETNGGEVDSEVQNIRDDPLFRMPWALNLLQRDLMLFENQLPFFILVELHGMILPPGRLSNLLNIAVSFFRGILPGIGRYRKSSNTINDEMMSIKHLLDLIHMNWGSQKVCDHSGIRSSELELMGCVGNLREAGIKFEKIEGEVCFDIEFKNGALRMPVLTIELRTESFLRNLIAFEQYYRDFRFQTVTDYMQLFTCLVKSDKDIATLTRCGILKSHLTDDVDASYMFKKIIDCTIGPSDNFHYADIFQRVNEHCRKPHNRYMAILRRDYMNSPWKIISVFSVSAILFLTVLEVVFQILSWQNQISSWKSQLLNN